MIDSKFLLSDEQMKQFITEGYVILQTDFPEEFHQNIFRKLGEVRENEGNPGNNVLPRIPEIRKAFEHPVIRGALTSVLGPEFIMHPHRHPHFNNRPTPQNWHKDSYWGHQKMRNHHPWWAMIFYYPQDVSEEMGPSGLMPGTQLYQRRIGDDSEFRLKATGKAGTFALIHYDLWHGATANIANKDRYMLKFQFVRLKAPSAPSWNHRGMEWTPPALDHIHPHQNVWRHMWNWHRGNPNIEAGAALPSPYEGDMASWLTGLRSADRAQRIAAADALGLAGPAAAGAVPALAEALEDEVEPVALNAAYGLARMGEPGIDALLQALAAPGSKGAVRTAAYALSTAGAAAVPGLTAALGSESDEAAGCAAFALGELGAAAGAAAPALAKLLREGGEWARRNAAEALGTIGAAEQAVPALAGALRDEDAQVRFTACLSLARLGAAAGGAVPGLVEALDDEDRYVRANAAEALAQIGTPEARDSLLRYLMASRWCATTNRASTF